MSTTRRGHAWRYHAVSWGPAAAYMVLIWVVSSFHDVSIPMDRVPLRDKGIHALEYAVLGFLVAFAVRRTWRPWRDSGVVVMSFGLTTLWGLLDPRRTWRPWRDSGVVVMSFGLTTLWGLLDEIHQAFVPGRMADVVDLLADAIGALIGAGACVLWMRWRVRARSRS